MDKQHILNEIKRTAEENGGKPLGTAKFFKETGINEWDWKGKHWARWGDAVREAGFQPNQLNSPINEERLIRSLIELLRKLERFPVAAELRLKKTSDPDFPSYDAIRRLGAKAEQIAKIVEYCRDRNEFEDVLAICEQTIVAEKPAHNGTPHEDDDQFGFVYLAKSGKHYKIGKTNDCGRREYELAIQLPEKLKLVHQIRTDDPAGIERYWHDRFAAQRKNGEWFELTAADVKVFRRRKFM